MASLLPAGNYEFAVAGAPEKGSREDLGSRTITIIRKP